jgi:hypothetical protein
MAGSSDCFPEQPAPTIASACYKLLICTEALRALARIVEPQGSSVPISDQRRLALRNGHEATVDARKQSVSSHVVAVAVGIDHELERLVTEMLGLANEPERLVCVRAMPGVYDHVVVRLQENDAVGA